MLRVSNSYKSSSKTAHLFGIREFNLIEKKTSGRGKNEEEDDEMNKMKCVYKKTQRGIASGLRIASTC